MLHRRHYLHRLRIPDQNVCAVIAIALILCPFAFSTTLLVLVSGNTIVFAADGKSIDTGGTSQAIKVITLEDRFLISSSGIAHIDMGSSRQVVYDFELMVKSLPVTNRSSTRDVADMIKSACWPIFSDEWNYLRRKTRGPIRPFNASGNPSLPIVSYFIGGSEFLGPEVYRVRIYADWDKQRLKQPEITQIRPPEKGKSARHNLFMTMSGEKGGGMDQMTTTNSALQHRYLKLYPKEVGALVYDEPLDPEPLVQLGRIMLTAEVETTPNRFGFPIRVCSLSPGQHAGCSDFDH